MTRSSGMAWGLPLALLALSAVPIIAGAVRVASLVQGAEITPENARFFAKPLPVVVHILAVSPFCILGAFQFSPSLRRRRPGWHRHAGRLVASSGLIAALSGLWMTRFYALPSDLQGPFLYWVRIVVGGSMAAAIVLAWAAIGRRDIARHRAFMIRAYALGQGAGTQLLTMLPATLILGVTKGLARDVLMSAAWAINIAVAEWIIRRRPRPVRREFPVTRESRSLT